MGKHVHIFQPSLQSLKTIKPSQSDCQVQGKHGNFNVHERNNYDCLCVCHDLISRLHSVTESFQKYTEYNSDKTVLIYQIIQGKVFFPKFIHQTTTHLQTQINPKYF